MAGSIRLLRESDAFVSPEGFTEDERTDLALVRVRNGSGRSAETNETQ